MFFPEAPHAFAALPNYRVASELAKCSQDFLIDCRISVVVVVVELLSKLRGNVVDDGFLVKILDPFEFAKHPLGHLFRSGGHG